MNAKADTAYEISILLMLDQIEDDQARARVKGMAVSVAERTREELAEVARRTDELIATCTRIIEEAQMEKLTNG